MGFGFLQKRAIGGLYCWVANVGDMGTLCAKREGRFAGVSLSRLLVPGQALFAALYSSFCPLLREWDFSQQREPGPISRLLVSSRCEQHKTGLTLNPSVY